jgi:hypothetical protein
MAHIREHLDQILFIPKARNGIESSTQAFSGLWLVGPDYKAS